MQQLALLTVGARGRSATYAGRALRQLRGAGASVTPLRGEDAAEALDLARVAVAAGVDTLVVVGGDAVVRLGAEAVTGTPARLGVVPAGEGSDAARALGLPRRDPDAAVRAVLHGTERHLDLMRVAGRVHVTALSAGVDTLARAATDRATGPVRLPRLGPIDYTLEIDGERLRVRATTVVVANTATSIGGLRAAGDARTDDGLLDVLVVPAVGRGHSAGPVRRRARRVTVAAPGVVAYADRERVGPLPLTAEVLPGALRVLAP